MLGLNEPKLQSLENKVFEFEFEFEFSLPGKAGLPMIAVLVPAYRFQASAYDILPHTATEL